MRIKAKEFVIIILIITGSYLFAQSGNFTGNGGLSRGESLFKENNAKDAVQVLEYEIMNGQVSDNSYNFLGLGYYQLGEYEKSIEAFKRGLKAQPDNAKILSYNMGNSYYALKDYNSAVSSYSEALKAEPLFYDALLNRANALLMAGQLLSAKDDYIDFIGKRPDDPQRERIELLIKALEEEIARREEEARLLAEQNKAQWEEYDGSLAEKKREGFSPDWEEVDGKLENIKKDNEDPEWEKFHNDNPGAITENNKKQKIEDDNKGERIGKESWETFEHDNSESLVESEEVNDKIEDWLTFSDDELDEMKELEKQSREEHEKWLESERRRAQEIANREAQARQKAQQNALEEERKMREQLIEEMRKVDEDRRKAEEERRKKLLEDVANSLQGSDSTNLTSGAEDLIDYDLEGELD